jgi:hypothetical protein
VDNLQPCEQADHGPEDGGLGRILFERRDPGHTTIWLIGVAVVWGSFGLLFLSHQDAEALWLGFSSLLASLGFGLAACLSVYHKRIAFFRCHEWGVRQRGLFKDRVLRYQDLASFTYGASAELVPHAGWTGKTTVTLVFEPIPEQKANRISYMDSLRKPDATLEHIRDHISYILTTRMLEQHQHGQPLRWTSKLCFLPEGLQYQPHRWFGRRVTQVLPYDQIARYHLDQYTFSLWAKEGDKPAIQESPSVPNFFPGFIILSLTVPGRGTGLVLEAQTSGHAEEHH